MIYTIDARGLETGGLNAEDNPVTRDWGFAGGGGGTSGGAPAVGSGAGFLERSSARIRTSSNDRLANLLDSQDSLKFIADQTGGLAIENTNDLNLGIRRILDDQQGYYLLGYLAPRARRARVGTRTASRSA